MQRYISIWLPYLLADHWAVKEPGLKGVHYVIAQPARGRIVVHALSAAAHTLGIRKGMLLADARGICPGLTVLDYEPGLEEQLLHHLSETCLRYTPVVSIDMPDSLLLDASGCAHLWSGEQAYLKAIWADCTGAGYKTFAVMADTAGAAWALCHYRPGNAIVQPGRQQDALRLLPPAALRLDAAMTERMQKLGLNYIGDFMHMPRTVLLRRFGKTLLERMGQALGSVSERLEPIIPVMVYQERLSCLEPVRTARAIEIALSTLLGTLCARLQQDTKGLRVALFRSYRTDGVVQEITIGTNSPSRHSQHLLRLFREKIASIAPGLGIELFVLEAPVVENYAIQQEHLGWDSTGYESNAVDELLDRIAGRTGQQAICRYLPDEHHWPERSVRLACSLQEAPGIPWPAGNARPLHLLPEPEPIKVSVPIPDYPPLLFIYKDQVHHIQRADGPERIEREWWIDSGSQRDYYQVEDRGGARYWIFRSGHYDSGTPEWYIHGFFA